MRGAVHSCCNSWEGAGPVVLSGVNAVSHSLFKSANSSLNLAIRLVVVLGGHPDQEIKGLHHF